MKPDLRLVSFLLVVAITGAANVGAQSASVPTWARDQLAAWYKAFNAGDAKAVAALYAIDATIMPPGQEPIRGRAAIEAFQRKVHDETKFVCSGAFDGFQVVANTAVSWGHDECTETPRAGGPSRETKTVWISVYEKQADGKWIVIRDVAETAK